jgi:imidazolonepropionase-like amidohydrolase
MSGAKPIRIAAVAAFSVLALCLRTPPALAGNVMVVHAERIFPVSGPAIEDGLVVIEDGRFKKIGRAGDIAVPSAALELRAKVVTPGFIDAHSSVGLAGTENDASVLDQDDPFEADRADLRALDGFNPNEPLLRHLVEHGVTLVQTGPGPASVIAGQAGVFRTRGNSADAMAVRFPSAMVFNLGETPKAVRRERSESPSTRMGTAAFIRRRLEQARVYSRATRGTGWFGSGEETAEFDASLSALTAVVEGDLPVIFTAHRADDILTAARIIDEFGLRGSIAGGTEAYLVSGELHDAELAVLAGPVMERVSIPERANASYETPALLDRAGVSFAIRSGYEAYVPRNRVVLFEAGVAVANGLSPEAALRSITLGAADLLEVADDYGSIEVGKVADLVLFDGDPFEYTTHVDVVVMDGEIVHRRVAE